MWHEEPSQHTGVNLPRKPPISGAVDDNPIAVP
jgi:hypothetical protein